MTLSPARLWEERPSSLKRLELGYDPSWGLSDYPDCGIDGGNDEKGTLAGGEELV
jgi:hypothetical protein